MLPKRPPPPSFSSSSGSSDEEEEQEVTHLTPPPPHKEHLPSTAATTTNDDSDTVEEDDEEDQESDDDDDGSAFCISQFPANPARAVSAAKPVPDGAESESESDSSDSDSGPTLPRRLETSIDSSKPMCGAPNGRKASTEKPKKRKQEAEVAEEGDSAVASATAAAATAKGGPSSKRGKKGAQKSWAPPSPSITCGSAAAKAEVEAGILYPSLREAVRLLEVENGRNLIGRLVCKALEELKPAEVTVLEEQWNRHFVAGIKLMEERLKLKEELLKSLIEIRESEE